MTTMVMFYWGERYYEITEKLRDMIIPRVAEYGEHVSIKFICRYPHRRNGDVMIYKKLSINDDRTLQNVLNIPSRHPDHQHVEIYVVKEEVSTMNTSGSHTASSRSTLAEEAPGQRMCSLFSQGECIEAGGASGSVDPVERLVALGETGTQDNEDADVFQSDNSDEDIEVLLTNEANDDFNDDGQEDPNVGEALHYNLHIPFFTNLVGADDVVGGRDLYDGCPTWSDVTPEFAKGMVFKDKDAVIRACNCHDCPWKLRACLKKQHGFFEIKQYPGPHTCLHGMDSLDHRNINSTFIAHLIKTQVAEDPGWKIASIVENVKNHSGFTVSYKKAWLGRTKAIAMVFGDWDSSYENLPSFMRTLELRNPGTAVILETLDLGMMGVRALDRIFWAFRPCIEGFKHCSPVIGIDGTFLYGRYTGVMLIAMAKTITNNIFPLAFALVESENYRDWSWFIHNVRHLIVPGMEGVTLISDRHAAIISAVKHEWEIARLGQPIGIHRYCLRHFRSNYQKNFGNVKVKDLIWKAGTAHQVRKFDEAMDEIKKLGTNSESAARAYHALCNEDPRKWTLAHDGGYRWGVITTNDSECYNNVLRGARDLPITSCVEVTFYRLVATFNDKRRQIESALAKGLRYTSKVQAKLEEYQARSAGHHVTICNWASGSVEVVTSAAGTTGNNKHAVYLNPPSFADEIPHLDVQQNESIMRWTSPENVKTIIVFTWRPYNAIMHELPDYCRVGSDIWVSRSPLVCFEVVEWHLPDRVCRQFGLRQVVPEAPNTSPALHGIDMRGRARTDWTQFHREHIDRWHHRLEYLVVGVIDDTAMHYDDPYMVWYRRITRTLVGNPAHRPTSGYVEIGSTIEIATRYIAVIHDRIDRAIYAYDQPESLQDLYDARDMCSRSLHALHEHQRIGQPRVPDPTTTMTPGFPSTSCSQQFTQYVGATQTSASYVTPTMPSYTYHMSSHDMPSSSRQSSSGVRPRRTTHRHITSPVTYDQSSSFLPVGDEEEFDGYVDPLLASGRQIEIPVSVEGVSQITQTESQRRLQPEMQPKPSQPQPEMQPEMQPHRLGTLTYVFSRRPRPSRDRRPPRCGTGGHV
ncbi:hypothetical protein Acr_28g0004980 [Actinidia rufa]|uniref:Uncharacterized protein n=1 Tax=Actinidia rufa TaxID=165716 RepID=A0A7J0H9J7_9ERIC|nr:hypothetical protein Acr_28g0004980 [Actinidia rufa]